jgi:hypothetical protein
VRKEENSSCNKTDIFMKKNTLTIIVLLLAFSCEKDNDSVFSGITETDEEAVRVGTVDDTDWRFDDVWDAREEGLFNPNNFKSTESLQEQSKNYSTESVGLPGCIVYPNPAIAVFNFDIHSFADTLRFVIVNNNYEIIHSKKVIGGSGTWMFNSSAGSKFKANSIYRIYYKLDYVDEPAERGHGDVKIKN